MSEELKNCPWCGSKARYRAKTDCYACSNIDCDADGPAGEDEGDSAAVRWNRRATPAPVVTEEVIARALHAFDVATEWPEGEYTDRTRQRNMNAMRAALLAALGGK